MCSCVAVGGGVLIAAYVTSSIVSIAGAVSGAKMRDVTIEGCFHTLGELEVTCYLASSKGHEA